MKKVATRFAPSPTGALHIGGVRTALFNWLYSKNQKGDFYLRVEDTDKERSKDEYKDQIVKSLKWIGINYDGEEYIQSKKIEDHIKDDDDFIVTYGDGLCNVNINDLIKFHKSHGKIATVTAVRPTARFGELLIDKDLVKSFKEKPQTDKGRINGGFFVFNKKFFEFIYYTFLFFFDYHSFIILIKYFKLKVFRISIDDFYKTRKERVSLSKKVHPMLLTRGVPGTHDINMMLSFFRKAKSQ